MYQPHHQSPQMHIMNNTRFCKGKDNLLGEKSETNSGQDDNPTLTKSTNGDKYFIQSTEQSCNDAIHAHI